MLILYMMYYVNFVFLEKGSDTFWYWLVLKSFVIQ